MSDNWVVQHLVNTLNTWNEKPAGVNGTCYHYDNYDIIINNIVLTSFV